MMKKVLLILTIIYYCYAGKLGISPGNPAAAKMFAYQVALKMKGYNYGQGSFCGGSLITRNHVLTSYDCVGRVADVDIILGAQNINKNENSQQLVEVTYESVLFDPSKAVAIIELPKSANLNKNVNTVQVNYNATITVGSFGTISGWGKTSDNSSSLSNILNMATVKIIDNIRCRVEYPYMCTTGYGPGACEGDFGGPLVQAGKQIAIIMSHESCTRYPTKYLTLQPYEKWIKSVTGD